MPAGSVGIISSKVCFHSCLGFFFLLGKKERRGKTQNKEVKGNNGMTHYGHVMTTSGHGESTETRIITYGNQKGGIVKGIRSCLRGEEALRKNQSRRKTARDDKKMTILTLKPYVGSSEMSWWLLPRPGVNKQ